MQSNNSEKQRRHLRKIQCVEDIEATVDSGAACCVFPRDLRNDVPIRQSAKSWRGVMFRTASGQKVAHESITIECSTEYGCTRRLTGAVTSVQKVFIGCISTRRHRSSSAVHQDGRMHFE